MLLTPDPSHSDVPFGIDMLWRNIQEPSVNPGVFLLLLLVFMLFMLQVCFVSASTVVMFFVLDAPLPSPEVLDQTLNSLVKLLGMEQNQHLRVMFMDKCIHQLVTRCT